MASTTIRQMSSVVNAGRRKGTLWLMLAVGPIVALFSSQAFGAGVTWDHTGASPTHPADGAGNWDITSKFWSNGVTDTAWVNDGTGIADFGDVNGAAGTVTINVATINAAGLAFSPAGSGNYTIAATVGDTLTLTGAANITVATALTSTISSVITGTSGLNYTGAGTASLVLSGVNTYSGTTTVNSGILAVSLVTGLGTSNITIVNGGQVVANGGAGSSNNFTISGTGTSATANGTLVVHGTIAGNITLNGNSRIGGIGFGDTFSGIISGTSNLEFFSAASGASTFTINNTANAWSGNTTVTSNSAGGSVFKMGASNVIPAATSLTLNAQSTGIAELDLSGRAETVAGLFSTGISANDKIINSSTGNGSLTIASSANAVFSGVILSGTGTGLTNIVKSGTGTQTFGGANTYTGTTTINQGVLAVTGSLASGNVTVNSTGTLAGSGTVGGVVLVNNGGSVAGAAGGTFALNGGLTLGNLSTDSEMLNLTANAASPTTASIAVSGTPGLTINSTSTTINVATAGAMGLGEYALMTYNTTSGTAVASAFTLGTLPQRVVGNLDTSNVGVVNLNVTSVDFPIWSGAVSSEWATSAVVQTGSADNWVLNSNNATPTNFVAGDNTMFNDSASSTTVDISSGNVAPASVIFNNSATDYTISGTNGITGSASLTKNGTGALTINTSNAYSGGTTLNAGTLNINNASAISTGSLTIMGGTIDNTSGTAVTLSTNNVQAWKADISFTGTNSLNLGTGSVALSASRAVNVGNNTLTVGGTISDAGNGFGLTKTGAGTLVLAGSNTYTGATTINAGTVVVTNSNSLGSLSGVGVTINSGGTLDLGGVTTANNFIPLGLSFTIAGTGTNGAGAITNSNANVTQFNAFRGNAVTLSADALITGNRIDIGRAAASTLNLNGHTLTLSMSGSQPMFGIESFASVTGNGNIVVAQGTLDIEQNASVLASGISAITFNSGANVQFFQTAAGGATVPMIFNGNNTIGSGNATVAATVNSPMTLTGNITLEAVANGVPSLTANDPLILAGNIAESGGSLSITKAGVSTVTLSGVNAWSGGTNVQAGTLVVGAAGALPTGTSLTFGDTANDNATLDLNGANVSVGGLTSIGTGTATISSSSSTSNSTLSYIGGISVFGGVIQDVLGAGTQTTGLTVSAGSLTLNGANTYSGATTVSGGELDIGGTGSIASTNVSVSSGGTLAVLLGGNVAAGTNLTNNGTVNFSNPTRTIATLNGAMASSVVNLNATNLTVSGGGAYAGAINDGGTGGTLTTDAVLSVGSFNVGAVNANANIQIHGTSKTTALNLLGGTDAWITGLDLTASKLIVEVAGSHATAIAQLQNQILTGKTSASGVFTSSTLNSNFALAVMDNHVLNKTMFGGVAVDPDSILVSAELVGDSNADGHVDLTDLSIVLNNFGTTTNAWTSGNFDGAATIDLTDLSDVLNNFGLANPNASAGQGGVSGAGAVATPEPASLAVLGWGAAALIGRRRKV